MKNYLIILITAVLSVSLAGQGVDNWKVLAERYAGKNRNQALMAALVQNGKVEYYAFGQISREVGAPPDENTLFEIGALTEVFTTTLMTKLAMEGDFDLSKPIREFLPEDTDAPLFQPQKCVELVLPTSAGGAPQRILSCTPDPLSDEISVALCDLATHSSGLPNSGIGLYDWHPIGLAYRLTGPRPGFDRAAFFRKLAECPLKTMPGSEYRFSNMGIALIGHLLSEARGEPFDVLLEKELLQPLGLNDTRFQMTTAQQNHFAPGFSDKGKPVDHWNFEGMSPAAGLKSSAHDLAAFVVANLRNDNSRWAAVMEQAQQARIDVFFPGLTRPTQAGYGWLISTLSPESNQPVVWMYGGTEGFRAFIGFIKEHGLGIVLLSNSANEIRELGFSMLSDLYGAHLQAGGGK